MPFRTGLRRTAAVAAAVLALTLTVAGCSADPVPGVSETGTQRDLPKDTRGQLQGAVTDAMAASGASGAIVGVWAPWSGSWIAGLGTVTPGGDTKVEPDMTFRAGAITRPMICDVLYQLSAAGTLSLDDSVTKYVGGMPKFTDVTLESLCDSTSGIGSYRALLDQQMLGNPGRNWDRRELVGYGVGQVGGEVRPGVAYRDSDAGYLLLGLALERATGKSSSELLRTYVFGPLGLRHSTLPGPAPAAPVIGGSQPLRGSYLGSRTKSGDYVCDKPTDITEQSASFGSTDSGVVSDIQDIAAYVRALAAGRLVKDKTRFADPLPVTPSSPSWFTTAGGAIQMGPLIGQYGSTPGYLAAAFSDPESGLTVAVVLNDSSMGRGVIVDLSRELAAIASKAPAVDGAKAPAVGLPWSAEQYHDVIAANAICSAAKKK
jgi:D-alanyl-D-alanine carboxypeptidase